MLGARELARRLDLLAAKRPTGMADPVRVACAAAALDESQTRRLRPKSLITDGVFSGRRGRRGLRARGPEAETRSHPGSPNASTESSPLAMLSGTKIWTGSKQHDAGRCNGPGRRTRTRQREEPDRRNRGAGTHRRDESPPGSRRSIGETEPDRASRASIEQARYGSRSPCRRRPPSLSMGGGATPVGAVPATSWRPVTGTVTARVTAAIVRPSTGGVVLFDAWPEPGRGPSRCRCAGAWTPPPERRRSLTASATCSGSIPAQVRSSSTPARRHDQLHRPDKRGETTGLEPPDHPARPAPAGRGRLAGGRAGIGRRYTSASAGTGRRLRLLDHRSRPQRRRPGSASATSAPSPLPATTPPTQPTFRPARSRSATSTPADSPRPGQMAAAAGAKHRARHDRGRLGPHYVWTQAHVVIHRGQLCVGPPALGTDQHEVLARRQRSGPPTPPAPPFVRSRSPNARTGSTSGSHSRRHCITASRATRRHRCTCRADLASSHCTTDRSATNGTIRSTPNSVSFWTIVSERPPFSTAKPTATTGSRSGHLNDIAHRLNQVPETARPPPAGSVADGQRVTGAQAQRPLKVVPIVPASTGASTSATSTCGPDRASPATDSKSAHRNAVRIRPSRLSLGSATSSPRSSASRRTSSSCSSVRSSGTSTTSWTSRSPRPRPLTWGTPRPAAAPPHPSRSLGDHDVLGAVEGLVLQPGPSAAWVNGTCSSWSRSLPLRWNRGWGRTLVCT